MKLWVISDLHVTGSFRPLVAPAEADIALIAGDFADGFDASLDFLRRTVVGRLPVVWVAGNHELFGHELPDARRQAQEAVASLGDLYLLDDSSIELSGVRFLGSTLWTDYRLHADRHASDRLSAMRAAKASLPDHKEIWVASPAPGIIARHYGPRDAMAMHEASVSWLSSALGQHFAGPTVVVSHHAPHTRSIAKAFEESPLSPAYASDLSEMLEDRGPISGCTGIPTRASITRSVAVTEPTCALCAIRVDTSALRTQNSILRC